MQVAQKVVVNQHTIGLGGMLTVLFVGLKLTGYIDWSWLWVFAPLWMPIVLAVLILLIIALGLMSLAVYDHRQSEKRRKARINK